MFLADEAVDASIDPPLEEMVLAEEDTVPNTLSAAGQVDTLISNAFKATADLECAGLEAALHIDAVFTIATLVNAAMDESVHAMLLDAHVLALAAASISSSKPQLAEPAAALLRNLSVSFQGAASISSSSQLQDVLLEQAASPSLSVGTIKCLVDTVASMCRDVSFVTPQQLSFLRKASRFFEFDHDIQAAWCTALANLTSLTAFTSGALGETLPAWLPRLVFVLTSYISDADMIAVALRALSNASARTSSHATIIDSNALEYAVIAASKHAGSESVMLQLTWFISNLCCTGLS